MKVAVAIAAFLALNSSVLAAQELKLPLPEIEKLPNGLEVVWFVNDSLPIVDLALLVKSGFRDDAPGKSGTAELLSSVLDRGDDGMSALQIAHSVEMLGASRYVSADEDDFSVGMHGLAPDAPVLLDLLAKISLHPDFPDAEVKREHERLLDRWNHIGDYGETLANLAFGRLITMGTSYGRGGFVSINEFRRVGREDVVQYYKKSFEPKNAVLMVVGRVNPNEFRPKIMSAFGNWQGEAPPRNWKNFSDPRLPYRFGEIVLIDRPDLTQAQVRIGFKAPGLAAPDHYPLVVANALLGEYFNSRLNSLIRDKLALTYSIGSSFSYSRDLANLLITSSTRNESVGQLIHKTIEVLKDLKQGPIPGDEVKMAKEYLEGGFPLSTATLGAVASRWLSGYVFNLGPGYLNEFVPKINAVEPGDVVAAVSKNFDLNHLVIVVAGDARAISKSLKEAGLGPIRQVSVQSLK